MRARLGTPLLPALLGVLLLLGGCGTSPPEGAGIYKLGRPYQIGGRWYYPSYDAAYDRVGVASWYGPQFHGRRTANGEVFDRHRPSAAHPTLPLPSIVRVTNLANRRSMLVRVNDRGPFVDDRLIDLSQAAARDLGFERDGVAPVRVEFVRLADDARGVPPRPAAGPVRSASAPGLQQVAAADASCRGRFIQVGAFAEPARAERFARELSVFVPVPVSAEPPGPDRLARVKLGPLADDGAVEATLRRLQAIGMRTAFPVDPGGERPWRHC